MNIIASGFWARALNTAAGIWLMAAPVVLGYPDALAASVGRVIGPVVASFAIIAMWEATRGVRYANTVLGGLLVLAPLVLGYQTTSAITSVLTGLIIMALSRVKGEITQEFAGGWKSLWAGKR